MYPSAIVWPPPYTRKSRAIAGPPDCSARNSTTSANRQPALAAYARGDDGKHRPYGLMVLQIEGDLIAGIVGFPDPWLFEQCGLPPELT